MVSASNINCGQNSFRSLVNDQLNDNNCRCPSLDFLNESTMRIR